MPGRATTTWSSRGDIDVRYFAMSAGAAARWTVKKSTPRRASSCRAWRRWARRQGVGLYHASPRDPVWEYVLSVSQAGECLDVQRQRVCLIGHSHVACYFSRNGGGETIGEQALDGAGSTMAQGEWLVNPGSVGQPRDGDPRAAYLMLDTVDLGGVLPPRRLPDRRGGRRDHRRGAPPPARRSPVSGSVAC